VEHGEVSEGRSREPLVPGSNSHRRKRNVFVRPAGQSSPVLSTNGIVKRKVASEEDKNLLVLLFNAKMAGNGLPVEMSPVLLTSIPEV